MRNWYLTGTIFNLKPKANPSVRFLLTVVALFAIVADVWAQTQPLPATDAIAVTTTEKSAPALPDVALPTLPEGSSSAPKTSSQATTEKTSVEEEKPSYTDFGVSLFYKKSDLEKLKVALKLADVFKNQPVPAEGVQTTLNIASAPPKITLTEYPVFYLSSIMYQPRRDWVLWLNGARVTAKKLPADMKVLSVGPDQVRLRWSPAAFPMLQARWASPEGNTKNRLIKKRLSVMQSASVSKDNAYVDFTLRPNQAYASAYNAVVEGKIAATPATQNANAPMMNGGAFEQTLRASGVRAVQPQAPAVNAGNAPRVVRPIDATKPARASGLTQSDAQTIGQVPSIFPGGVPAAAVNPKPATPVSAGNSGMPILPQGVTN